MTQRNDLIKLKELLTLHQRNHILSKDDLFRYNELVDWTMVTYWSIYLTKLVNYQISLDTYYTIASEQGYILQGKYYFIPKYFGIRHVFIKNTLYNLSTNTEIEIPEFQELVPLVLDKFTTILALVFVEYRNKLILQDIIVPNNKLLYTVFKYAKEIGIRVAEYITLDITVKINLKKCYKIIKPSLPQNELFYQEGLIVLREDNNTREIIHPSTIYCCIQSIKLDQIKENKWIPYILTFTNERVNVSDITSLIQARLYIGSFIQVIKDRTNLLLSHHNKPELQIDTLEYIRKILGYFKNKYYIMDSYMSSIQCINNLKNSNIKMPYVNEEELVLKLKEKDFLDLIHSKSLFDLSCEYFLHDKLKIVTLINNMEFKLNKQNKIRSFDLISTNILKDKTVEIIFNEFYKFILIFNAFAEAKSRSNDNLCG